MPLLWATSCATVHDAAATSESQPSVKTPVRARVTENRASIGESAERTDEREAQRISPGKRDPVRRVARCEYSYRVYAMLFSCLGDLNGDGEVGITDFLDLLAEWGPCYASSSYCFGDLDGDGTVGINDFLDLLAAWGPCA